MTLQPRQPGAARRAVWLAPLALLLMLFLALMAVGWPSTHMQQFGPRLLWLLLLLWSLLAIVVLHGVRGLGWTLACAAIFAPLGLLPWIGLGALLMVGLVLPVALLGSFLAGSGRFQEVGGTIAAVSIRAVLCSLAALSPSAGCGPLPAVRGTHVTEQLAWIAHSDQADRRSACFVFNPKRDVSRRAQVKNRLNHVEELPPQALADAGLVLLHSTETGDLELAHALLRRARMMGHTAAEPLEHAAIDRLRLKRGQSQLYGTQWLHSN